MVPVFSDAKARLILQELDISIKAYSKYTESYVAMVHHGLAERRVADGSEANTPLLNRSAASSREPQPSPAKPKETISARIFHLGNAGSSAELDLVRAIFPTRQIFRISDDYTVYVDDDRDFYNTLFVIGADLLRIRKFMRIYRPLFMAKGKIAIIRDTRPSARVQMLNLGFDDVFDAGTEAAEASARVRAIVARIGQATHDLTRPQAQDIKLDDYAALPLLGREERILGVLAAAAGSPVRTHQLATSTKATRRPIGTKSLQVLISGLRAKLKPDVSIISHGPAGYSLQHHGSTAATEPPYRK